MYTRYLCVTRHCDGDDCDEQADDDDEDDGDDEEEAAADVVDE